MSSWYKWAATAPRPSTWPPQSKRASRCTTIRRLLPIRDTDVAVRYGGEEFAVILPNTDTAGAEMMGERLRDAIASSAWTERAITISVGAATAVSHLVAADALVELADRALYRSKQAGRNRVTLADAA